MKLYMKQKVFSWKDRFSVKDEFGTDRYSVEGEIFTLAKKLHVYGGSGQEVAFIRQKLLALMPRYYIEIGGRTIELIKEFTLLKPRFRFDGLPWKLKGNFLEHEYELLNDGDVVMQLSKKWISWGDTYELDIPNPRDELLCLCAALAVDCVLAQQSASVTVGASS